MRNIIAGIIGLISGVFFIGLIEWVGYLLFPADLPFPVKREEWPEYFAQVPFMAKFFTILAYAAGGFVAGIVASFIQGRTFYRPVLVTTVVMQLFAWLNMAQFPHPLWMWLAGTIVIIPMGYIAFRWTRKPAATAE